MPLWKRPKSMQPMVIVFIGSSLAYYVLMTTLSTYLHDYLNFPVTTVSAIMFGYIFVSRLSKVALGPWFDRRTFRSGLIFALSISAGGFLLASPNSIMGKFAPWCLCIAGVGTASVVLLIQSFIANQKQTQLRRVTTPADYSFIYILMNGTALVAPFIGFEILRYLPQGLYWIIGGFYLLLLIYCLAYISGPENTNAPTPRPTLADWLMPFKQRRYCRFLLINSLLWMLHAQLYSTIPLYIRETLGGENHLTLFFTVEALCIMVLQHWVSLYINQHIQPYYPAVVLLLFSLSFFLIYLAQGMVLLLLAGAVFALARMVFMPSADASNAAFASPGSFATYFGLASLSATLGDSFGSMLGMWGFAFLLQSGDIQQYFLWLAGITAALAIFCRNPYNCPL
ncbi:MFS transporter [Yersinia aleksiciae]|uniref:MFS transporter n=1 Tax=Yersinia aleksiciae TaxID=263819 RepID=UPI001FCBCC7E|nr:MFS transporter [Yersinia aleksiciae]MDA5496167.1 MFS transporter [Yersinia aleksiciae]WQC70568.1 MFS transporter [Yersinia aleksiciae]